MILLLEDVLMDKLSFGTSALLNTELFLVAERLTLLECLMRKLIRPSKLLLNASMLLSLKFLNLTRTLLLIFSSFPMVLRLIRKTPLWVSLSISSLSLRMVKY